MMDSEIGLNKGTRTNSTQRFEDFAGELPGRGEIERWCRSTKSYMTNDQKAVLQGRTPAKLALDTEPFDYTTLPLLPASANDTHREKIGRSRSRSTTTRTRRASSTAPRASWR